MQIDKVQEVRHRIGEAFYLARGIGGESAYHKELSQRKLQGYPNDKCLL